MNRQIRKALHAGTCLMFLCGMAWQITAFGASNTIPYAETFQYELGSSITNQPGWSGYEFDASIILENNFDFVAVTRPINPPVAHNHVLSFDTDAGVLTNTFAIENGEFPSLYFDAMVNFNVCEDLPSELIDDGETKLDIHLNDDNHLVVFHGGADGNSDCFTVLTNFVEETPVPMIPGEWFRLTVEMDMEAASISVGGDDRLLPFFRVKLNGVVLAHESEGYPIPSGDSTEYTGGSWFRFANTSALVDVGQYRNIAAVDIMGTGLIDDLVLSNVEPTYTPLPGGMYWIRSGIQGPGSHEPSGDLEVPEGENAEVSFLADEWHEIVSFETNGVHLTDPLGCSVYTASFFNVQSDISNHVEFGVTMLDVGDNGIPATWYGPIWGADPPLVGAALSLYEAWLLNQSDLDSPFEIIAVGLTGACPFVRWRSGGPANGVVNILSSDSLPGEWDPSPLPGSVEHEDGVNTWTGHEVVDAMRFYKIDIVSP